jgi:tyrosyl-tRNA synthetase
MSWAEFSYPLLQAWDWWELFQKGCQVQVGGADQFGNILFGMDAVKTISQNTRNELAQKDLKNVVDRPIGFTVPLLTTSSGEKIGKSAGNATWLDKDLTPTFDLYQFFMRVPDADAARYLKMFTFVPLPKITELMDEHWKDPSKRVAQHALASEVVNLVHGPDEAKAVEMQHRQLFRPRDSTAEPTPLPVNATVSRAPPNSPTKDFLNPAAGNRFAPQTNFQNMPGLRIMLPRSLVVNQQFHKILWHAGLVSSRNEGHRLIVNNGAYVGSRPGFSGPMGDRLEFSPIRTWAHSETEKFIQDGNLLMLKVGKWKMKIVDIISDEEFEKRGLTCPGWDEFKQERDAATPSTTRLQETELAQSLPHKEESASQ